MWGDKDAFLCFVLKFHVWCKCSHCSRRSQEVGGLSSWLFILLLYTLIFRVVSKLNIRVSVILPCIAGNFRCASCTFKVLNHPLQTYACLKIGEILTAWAASAI